MKSVIPCLGESGMVQLTYLAFQLWIKRNFAWGIWCEGLSLTTITYLPQWDFPAVVVWTLSDLCLIGRDPTEREPLHNPWCWCHWQKLPTKEGKTGMVQLTDQTFTTLYLIWILLKKSATWKVWPLIWAKAGIVQLTYQEFLPYINGNVDQRSTT